RLVQYARTGLEVPSGEGLIVPKKPLQQLKNNLSADDTPLQLSFNSSHLFVSNDKITMSCRLIDARFPDYKAVIPVDNPFLLTINRADFLSALKRVSIFSSKSTSQIALEITGNSLVISAQDIDFSNEGHETLSCQYQGEDIKIAFNARLLIEMLVNMDGDEIQIELSTPNRAGILRPIEDGNEEKLLML